MPVDLPKRVRAVTFDVSNTLLDVREPGVVPPPVIDGVRETLGALREAGIVLGVVSNNLNDVTRHLEPLGLSGFFAAVTHADEAGFAKPDPAIYARSLERIGAEAATTVHVGDMLREDVEGAAAAGIAGVLFDPWQLNPHAECVRIESMPELPGLLGLRGQRA